jgi:putative transcriptional regulator
MILFFCPHNTLKRNSTNNQNNLRGERMKKERLQILLCARKSKGLRQITVAQSVGITHGAYSNIECGKRNPSVPLAKRLGKLLDFDWTNLFLYGLEPHNMG